MPVALRLWHDLCVEGLLIRVETIGDVQEL
jgi:hypothetical protein